MWQQKALLLFAAPELRIVSNESCTIMTKITSVSSKRLSLGQGEACNVEDITEKPTHLNLSVAKICEAIA
jgi:hypothetical protein